MADGTRGAAASPRRGTSPPLSSPSRPSPVVNIDLLNGCSGVGTGWRTEIPPLNPLELIDLYRARVIGAPDWRSRANAALPWYDGFTGAIEANDTAWQTYGLYHIEEDTFTTTVVISELPVGVWTEPYLRDVLLPLVISTPKKKRRGTGASATTGSKKPKPAANDDATAIEEVVGDDGDDDGDDGDADVAAAAEMEGQPRRHKPTHDGNQDAEDGIDDDDKVKGVRPFIIRIQSDTTDTRIRFTLVCDSVRLYAAAGEARAEPFEPDARGFTSSADASVLAQAAEVYARKQRRYPDLERVLGLRRSVPWGQMYRFSVDSRIVHYDTVADIIDAYHAYRLDMYAQRLRFEVHAAERVVCKLDNKLRFMREIMAGTMDGKAYATEAAWWADLAARGYTPEGSSEMAEPPKRLASELPILARGDKTQGAVEDQDQEPAEDVEEVEVEEDAHHHGERFLADRTAVNRVVLGPAATSQSTKKKKPAGAGAGAAPRRRAAAVNVK